MQRAEGTGIKQKTSTHTITENTHILYYTMGGYHTRAERESKRESKRERAREQESKRDKARERKQERARERARERNIFVPECECISV